MIERLRTFLDQEVWRRDAAWVRLVQIGVMTAEGFVRDQLLLRAHSLTYITMLSLIPLLALMVSLLEALGVREDLVELAIRQIAAVAPEAAGKIRELVERVNFASLGTLGAVTLFVTTVLAIGNVERSLNHIWGIQRQRGWVQRFPDYLAVIVIVPLVLGAAISLGTTLRSQSVLARLLDVPLFEAAYRSGLRQLPTAMVVAGFGFVYWFLPNTSVRPLSALLGGAVGGVLFTAVQALYVGLSVGVARYNAVFGTFAALPLLIVWIYLSWALFLLGAEVAFAHQNVRRYQREVRGDAPGPAAREAIGLAIALQVARRFAEGAAPWTADALSDELDVRVRTVREVLAQLEDAGILASSGDEGWLMARPADRTTLGQVLRALRGPRGAVAGSVAAVFEEIDKRQQEITERDTLADLLK